MIDDLDDVRLYGHDGSVCVTHNEVFALYLDCVRDLYDDAYLTRRGELRQHKIRSGKLTYNDRHVLWGQVRACERLLPELRYLEASLDAIDEEAHAAAWEWLREQTRLGKFLVGEQAA